MTREQEIIVEQYMAQNDHDQEAINAMWLAEEMWEQHCAIMRAKNEMVKMSGSKYTNQQAIEKATWMMNFCMSLMEYIWLPHDIIKSITEDLDTVGTLPEFYEWIFAPNREDYPVYMSYITCNHEGHDYEKRELLKRFETQIDAEALTIILNHANKAGHDAVTRLSA